MSPRDYEIEDSPFAEPEFEHPRRRTEKPKRRLLDWEIEAEKPFGPRCWFECCGIRWGNPTTQMREIAMTVHRNSGHEPVIV